MISPLEINFARVFGAIDSPLGSKLYPKKEEMIKVLNYDLSVLY